MVLGGQDVFWEECRFTWKSIDFLVSFKLLNFSFVILDIRGIKFMTHYDLFIIILISVPVERVSSGRRSNNNEPPPTVQRRTTDVARRGDMGDKRKSYTTSIVIAPRGKNC